MSQPQGVSHTRFHNNIVNTDIHAASVPTHHSRRWWHSHANTRCTNRMRSSGILRWERSRKHDHISTQQSKRPQVSTQRTAVWLLHGTDLDTIAEDRRCIPPNECFALDSVHDLRQCWNPDRIHRGPHLRATNHSRSTT